MSEHWVDGTYEAGSDDASNEPIEPTGGDEGLEHDVEGGSGAEIGIGEGSTFEPEEDTEAP